jgi:hypothetical protein
MAQENVEVVLNVAAAHEGARRSAALPERTLDEVLAEYPQHRQSLLADADQCMLATRWRMEEVEATPHAERQDREWSSASAARGILAHRYCARIMETLWMTGETEFPIAEALEVLYEVCAQRDVPDSDVVYIPAREQRYLRMFAIRVVAEQGGRLRTWNMSKVLSVETRLWAKVTYDHPQGGTVERTITGQPDLVLAGGDGEVVVIDWKSTPKAPAKPPEAKLSGMDWMADDVPNNVSYEGYFQQWVYAVLLLANMPHIDRVTLRELYPMDPDGLQVRKATVTRDDLERISRNLSVVVELLDRAIMGGSESALWKPTPGKHCSYCPRPGTCPIPREERREGAIESPEQAEAYGAQALVAKSVYDHRRAAIKAWHEATGLPIPVKYAKGRLEWRYESGSKRFGTFIPASSDKAPEDENLSAIFSAAAERRRAAA